jgi:hypothetical protein
MTTKTLAVYSTEDTKELVRHTPPHGRDDDRGYSLDGYDWMDEAAATHWYAVANWGKDGWDCGAWPYTIMTLAKGTDEFGPFYGCTSYCEGDLTTKFFRSQAEQWKYITTYCHWQWKNSGEQWAKALPEKAEDLDMEIYGRPYGDEYDGKVSA